MKRREFIAAVAGVSAAGLAPSQEAAAESKKSWDLLSERYDQNAMIVFRNNLQEWWMEQQGQKCADCSLTRVKSQARIFSPQFIQDCFEKAQAELTDDLEIGFVTLAPQLLNHKFTIEAMELPAALITRGDRSIPVVSNTRRLRARWSPRLAAELSGYELHGTSAEEELRSVLTDQIALDIRLEMAADRKNLEDGDELVFCPYKMPLMTPTFYTKDDFTPRKGVLMRYAKVVFPKSGEPRVIETPLAHSEDYELKT